eukprot:scaffold8079_cov121-Cylindrotheca_fusiformis.AAC.10
MGGFCFGTGTVLTSPGEASPPNHRDDHKALAARYIQWSEKPCRFLIFLNYRIVSHLKIRYVAVSEGWLACRTDQDHGGICVRWIAQLNILGATSLPDEGQGHVRLRLFAPAWPSLSFLAHNCIRNSAYVATSTFRKKPDDRELL